MCQKTVCNVCKKLGWVGCGQHIAAALAGIPQDQLCTCNESRMAVLCDGVVFRQGAVRSIKIHILKAIN